MLEKDAFAALWEDFVVSQELIEIVHDCRRGQDFVCHHNSYLVAGFLRRRGHEGIRWVSGVYRCQKPRKSIHHSWLKLTIDGRTAAILEFDPRQLHDGGGYEHDLMPSGYVPELSMNISGIALIVDPGIVELPDNARDSRWVVQSKEILLRYVEDSALVPTIDIAELDSLGAEAEEQFDMLRELMDETDS